MLQGNRIILTARKKPSANVNTVTSFINTVIHTNVISSQLVNKLYQPTEIRLADLEISNNLRFLLISPVNYVEARYVHKVQFILIIYELLI